MQKKMLWENSLLINKMIVLINILNGSGYKNKLVFAAVPLKPVPYLGVN